MARRRPPAEPVDVDAEELVLLENLREAEDMARRFRVVIEGPPGDPHATEDMHGDRVRWLRRELEEHRRRRREAETDGSA